jgi:drug/metabolite transporter (DMT)-like permease
MTERRLPPVGQIAVASMALIIAGGIYLAAHIPQPVSLAPAIALLAASAVLVAVNVVLLSRIERFAWRTFFTVARWASLAYMTTAALLAYVFILNHVRGDALVVTLLSLVVYAVNVPLILAFGVARYQPADD